MRIFFLVMYGKNVLSALRLEVSLSVVVGTVPRLERGAWSLVE